MTEPARTPLVYRIDGRKIKSPKDFYRQIGRAVNGRGGYFGRNLDALADCLRGGFGTPDDRPFSFEWLDSEVSRHRLDSAGRNQIGSDTRSFIDQVQEVFDDVGVRLELR